MVVSENTTKLYITKGWGRDTGLSSSPFFFLLVITPGRLLHLHVHVVCHYFAKIVNSSLVTSAFTKLFFPYRLPKAGKTFREPSDCLVLTAIFDQRRNNNARTQKAASSQSKREIKNEQKQSQLD